MGKEYAKQRFKTNLQNNSVTVGNGGLTLQLKHVKHSECQPKQPLILNQEALYLWFVFGIEFVLQEKMAQIKIFMVQNTTSEQ